MSIFKVKNIFFTDILHKWLQNKKNIKIQTFQKYERLINLYLVNSLGFYKLRDINAEIIMNFLNDEANNGMSISVQKTILYIIKSSIRYAEEKKLCKNINLDSIKLQKYIPKIKILCKSDQLKLEEYLKSDINIRKICLLLCLYTGIRIGELCGLKWNDIDFINKNIIIKRTIQRIKNNDAESKRKTKLIESTPKSETSNRIIPIPEFLIDLLKKYKSRNNYYILSRSQKYYDPRQFEYFYERVLYNCNINYVNFHTLRHTFATRAIESKMDIKTLSEILGHSSVDITLKIYVHSSLELKKQCIENLVNFMTN